MSELDLNKDLVNNQSANVYATDIYSGLTVDFLRSTLDYFKLTGLFLWKHRDGNKSFNMQFAGKPAGCVNKSTGYMRISINGRLYLTHRLAWLYCFSEWPVDQLDHINGIRTDNRIENLREVTNQQNMFNQKVMSTNTSGTTGVRFNEQRQKLVAYITVNGQDLHLGYFLSEQEAIAVRKAAELLYFGEHSLTASRTN